MTYLTVPVARALLPEWRLALTAERKSPKTAYMARDDQERREAADELTRLNLEMGLL
jgi:hypothetical protein